MTTSTWTTARTSAGSSTGPWTLPRWCVGSPCARRQVGLTEPGSPACQHVDCPGDCPRPPSPSLPIDAASPLPETAPRSSSPSRRPAGLWGPEPDGVSCPSLGSARREPLPKSCGACLPPGAPSSRKFLWPHLIYLKKKTPRGCCLLTDVPLAGWTPSWQSPTRPRPRPRPTQDAFGRRPAPAEVAGQAGAQGKRTGARGDRVPPPGAQHGGVSPSLPRSYKRFKKSFQHSLTPQHHFLTVLSEGSKPRC